MSSLGFSNVDDFVVDAFDAGTQYLGNVTVCDKAYTCFDDGAGGLFWKEGNEEGKRGCRIDSLVAAARANNCWTSVDRLKPPPECTRFTDTCVVDPDGDPDNIRCFRNALEGGKKGMGVFSLGMEMRGGGMGGVGVDAGMPNVLDARWKCVAEPPKKGVHESFAHERFGSVDTVLFRKIGSKGVGAWIGDATKHVLGGRGGGGGIEGKGEMGEVKGAAGAGMGGGGEAVGMGGGAAGMGGGVVGMGGGGGGVGMGGGAVGMGGGAVGMGGGAVGMGGGAVGMGGGAAGAAGAGMGGGMGASARAGIGERKATQMLSNSPPSQNNISSGVGATEKVTITENIINNNGGAKTTFSLTENINVGSSISVNETIKSSISNSSFSIPPPTIPTPDPSKHPPTPNPPNPSKFSLFQLKNTWIDPQDAKVACFVDTDCVSDEHRFESWFDTLKNDLFSTETQVKLSKFLDRSRVLASNTNTVPSNVPWTNDGNRNATDLLRELRQKFVNDSKFREYVIEASHQPNFKTKLEASMQGKCVANVCTPRSSLDPFGLLPSTKTRITDVEGSNLAFVASDTSGLMYSSDGGASYKTANAISCSRPDLSAELIELCRDPNVAVVGKSLDASSVAHDVYRIELNVKLDDTTSRVDRFVWANAFTTSTNDDLGKLDLATTVCARNASACPATYCARTSAGCVPNGNRTRVPEIILKPLGGR